MNEEPDDEELLARYRQASAAEDSRPSRAVRVAIRAQAWKQAAVPATKVTAVPATRAANDSHWRMRAVAGLAVVAIGVAMVLQIRRSPGPQTPVVAAVPGESGQLAGAEAGGAPTQTDDAQHTEPEAVAANTAEKKAAVVAPEADASAGRAADSAAPAPAPTPAPAAVVPAARTSQSAVVIPATVPLEFERDSDQVGTTASTALREVVAYLRSNDISRAEITTFYDANADRDAGLDLARRRGTTVQSLLNSLGVPQARIVVLNPVTREGATDEVGARVDVRNVAR